MVKAIVGQNWESAVKDFYCQYELLHNEVTSGFPGILKLIAFLKKKNMEYLLKKYSISKEEFCYIGDTVQDIKDCQDIGVVCFSAAWQESPNADILEKENPHHVFYCVNDLYEYFNRK